MLSNSLMELAAWLVSQMPKSLPVTLLAGVVAMGVCVAALVEPLATVPKLAAAGPKLARDAAPPTPARAATAGEFGSLLGMVSVALNVRAALG